MKTYKVTITETLKMEVEIEATADAAAEEICKQNWKDGEYILDADCFHGVDFNAKRIQKERSYER